MRLVEGGDKMREIKCWEKRKEEGARCPYWHDDPGLECPGYPHLCNDVVEIEGEGEDEEED